MRRPLLTLVGALSALALTTALHAQNPTQKSPLLNHTRSHPSAHAVRRPGRDLSRDLRDLRRDRRDLRLDRRDLRDLRLDRREGAGPRELRRGRVELCGDRRELRRDHQELGRSHLAGRHDRPGMRRVRRSHASPWI